MAFNDTLSILGVEVQGQQLIRNGEVSEGRPSLRFEAFVYEYMLRNIISALMGLGKQERESLSSEISWGLVRNFEAGVGMPDEKLLCALFEKIWMRCNRWLEELARSNDRPIIGFHVISRPGLLWSLWLSREIRRRRSDALIVLGGHCIPGSLLRNHPEVDAVALGEAERTLAELADHFDGTGSWQRRVAGIKYRSTAGEPQLNPEAPPVKDLDTLAPPDYGVLPIDEYPQQRLGFPVLPVVGSRGCTSRCAFCVEWVLGYRTFRWRSAQSVVEEIAGLRRGYGDPLIRFNDSLINANPGRLEAFCGVMMAENPGASWIANARLSETMTPAMLRKMNRAGCIYLSYGLESASPAVQARMKKRIDPETAARVVRDTTNAGIHVHLFLIVGFPGETNDDMRMTKEFLKRNREWIGSISASKFSLLEGSAMALKPGRFGLTVESAEGKYWNNHVASYPEIDRGDERVSELFECWKAVKKPVEFPFAQVLQHI